MNVVLYGATGNSGQRILKELTNRGHHVVSAGAKIDRMTPRERRDTAE
jgi:uncharacterized protein YbjT (DUF2867 family)